MEKQSRPKIKWTCALWQRSTVRTSVYLSPNSTALRPLPLRYTCIQWAKCVLSMIYIGELAAPAYRTSTLGWRSWGGGGGGATDVMRIATENCTNTHTHASRTGVTHMQRQRAPMCRCAGMLYIHLCNVDALDVVGNRTQQPHQPRQRSVSATGGGGWMDVRSGNPSWGTRDILCLCVNLYQFLSPGLKLQVFFTFYKADRGGRLFFLSLSQWLSVM